MKNSKTNMKNNRDIPENNRAVIFLLYHATTSTWKIKYDIAIQYILKGIIKHNITEGKPNNDSYSYGFNENTGIYNRYHQNIKSTK